ncbi:E3 ubiquitin-protein ligase RGLG2-like isoform X1 [Tasmannia lanceolata]|uniref:E3 ubiquitin-protein ligase RGLG2-like isoform X1 n=1 Tax=Tasmannia lanceolata TaxID=3420 RepID=UPI004064593B
MGAKLSKTHSHKHCSFVDDGRSSSWGNSPQPSYFGNPVVPNIRRLQSRYSKIADNYNSLEQVTEALARAGLESSNLIVGIDFTKSNEWTGARSFNRRCLHHIGDIPNPYEQAISIIGRTLSAFDEDNLIPCFGFGDASTHDREVFSFYPDERLCNGFEEALMRYRELVPHLKLAGPTSFAPIIETAVRIVEDSGGQYHVLLIIADGQVTRSVDTRPGHFSPQEQDTINAIVKASEYPLSIVLVGVGDGPWDMMRQFDDNIPARAFDNFQFVNFTEIMARNIPTVKKETAFGLAALMEIPSQYKATLELQLLGRQRWTLPQGRVSLPPPIRNYDSANGSSRYSQSGSFGHGSGIYSDASAPPSENISDNYPPPENPQCNHQACPLCLWSAKDLALGCGHQTCFDCGRDLKVCPICRCHITTRIRLY